MSAAFPEIAELKLIICGPNIFGPLFDKISRVLEHSTPENKKKKNSKIISNLKIRPEKKNPRKIIKPQYPLCHKKHNKYYIYLFTYLQFRNWA